MASQKPYGILLVPRVLSVGQSLLEMAVLIVRNNRWASWDVPLSLDAVALLLCNTDLCTVTNIQDDSISDGVTFLRLFLNPTYALSTWSLGLHISVGYSDYLILHFQLHCLAPPETHGTSPPPSEEVGMVTYRTLAKIQNGTTRPTYFKGYILSNFMVAIRSESEYYRITVLADAPLGFQFQVPDRKMWEDFGLVPYGSCRCIAQFFFELETTLNLESLDDFMFDESFNRSKLYFSLLQILRTSSNMIGSTLSDWSRMEKEWQQDTALQHTWPEYDRQAASHNWNKATLALRDLFNATSLRESTKSIVLNRAIYVFTIVTVIYTPIGFLARVRCVGHILNLIARAFLDGENKETIKKLGEGSDERLSAEQEKELLVAWRETGPLGKLHYLVHFARRTPQRKDTFNDFTHGKLLPEEEAEFSAILVDP
ncbi:hypothetical protein QBC36DRAFT_295879, partial [Triangularia setosa]